MREQFLTSNINEGVLILSLYNRKCYIAKLSYEVTMQQFFLCVNGNTGFYLESRIFYFRDIQQMSLQYTMAYEDDST